MQLPAFVLLAALAALALPAPAGAQPGRHGHAEAAPPSAAPPQAAKVVDAFHAALARGDTAGALAQLSDDALIFEAGGAERSKAEYLAEHLPADAEFAKTTEAKVEWRTGRASGATAWIASEGRTTGQFRGKLINSRTTETMVLTRMGGRWKISHIHWSSAGVR